MTGRRASVGRSRPAGAPPGEALPRPATAAGSDTTDVTWILVAGRGRARLFAHEPPRELAEMVDFFNPDARAHGAQPTRDRAPRVPGTAGTAPHAIEQPEDASASRFAEELATMLEEGRAKDAYGKLIVIAPTRFLGGLRKAMPKPVRARVAAEINRDLTLASVRDIRVYLPPRPRVPDA